MIANPAITPSLLATSTMVSLSRICRLTLAGIQRQWSPYSICSRDIEAIVLASDGCAALSVMLAVGFKSVLFVVI
jgi:hypothetical protein